MRSNVPLVYQRLYRWSYGSERVKKTLGIIDLICVILTVTIFAFSLVFTGVREASVMTPIRLILSTGIPFVAVSIMRHALDMPRPCKVFELDFLPDKKVGKSFPSRHVFSAFSIGTALCFTTPLLGIFTLVLGVLVSFCRVTLGNHFIRDVVAGALIGIGCSVIGMLIL